MEATALEFLKIQVDFNNDVISKNIAGISNEEAMIFPDNNANPANWILGHLIFIRNAMIQVLGGDKVWEDEEFSFYDRGEIPLQKKEKFIEFETLKSYFKDTENELNRIFRSLEKIEPETINDLAGLMLHEIYHAGQLGYLRRILGKEGAIK